MRIISQSPIYNLKAALQETGLTADVLRAWERRYGLPNPQRTPGGHRLYSEYDIETVKWLRARQAEGLSISHAVQLWKQIAESGRDPLVECDQESAAPPTDILPAAQPRIELLLRDWLDAGLAFDGRKAEEVLNQAFALYPVETVCLEILQPGLHKIGSGWYRGSVSAQQEHFVSALAVRRLETLITVAPPPTRSQVVLLGCPPGERHIFPVLLLNLLLNRRGLDVVYLGANVPTERLEETAAAIRPNLVVLAAQQLTTAASLRSAALLLRSQGFPLAYGGLIFNRIPELRSRIPAHFLGSDLAGALPEIERLLQAPPETPAAAFAAQPTETLSRLYREHKPLIDLRLYERLSQGELDIGHLVDANNYFGSELAAALELGDPALLEADLAWVNDLLEGRRIPEELLAQYLAAYSQAVQQELGEAAAPITGWIASYLNRSRSAHT